MENNKDICCPEFNPEPWDNKIFEWNDKLFYKAQVKTFLYMPLNYGSVMKYIYKLFQKNDINLSNQICLSEHISKWKMNLYIELDKEITDEHNYRISGKIFSKVYEGKFNNTELWTKDFYQIAKISGLSINQLYMWYTTCPKCAKKYGKNYVVLLGKISD